MVRAGGLSRVLRLSLAWACMAEESSDFDIELALLGEPEPKRGSSSCCLGVACIRLMCFAPRLVV